jgi:hypothetical protein
MATYTQRMTGAARLNIATYEEVEADSSSFGQAMGVVVLSSVAAGIGMIGQQGGIGLIAGTVGGLIGWFFWAWVTYIIGTRLLPAPQTHADWGQLLRTTGFAAAPGIFRVLAVVPLIAGLVFFVTGVWMLVAFVIAVRQALDYTSTWRAVGVCLIGWIAYGVIFFVLSRLFMPA